MLIAWHQMEKPDIARRSRNQRGEEISAAQDRKPHQISFAEETRKHDACRSQVNRRSEILDGFLVVADLDQRESAADQPQYRQQQKGNEFAVERDACGN